MGGRNDAGSKVRVAVHYGQGYTVQSPTVDTGEKYGGYSSHCLSASVPVSSSSRMGVSVPSKEKPNRPRSRHGFFPERRA